VRCAVRRNWSIAREVAPSRPAPVAVRGVRPAAGRDGPRAIRRTGRHRARRPTSPAPARTGRTPPTACPVPPTHAVAARRAVPATGTARPLPPAPPRLPRAGRAVAAPRPDPPGRRVAFHSAG